MLLVIILRLMAKLKTTKVHPCLLFITFFITQSDDEGVKNKIPVVTPRHVLAQVQGKQSLWNSIFAAYALIPQGTCEASQDQASASEL